jgi:hypothetical protein
MVRGASKIIEIRASTWMVVALDTLATSGRFATTAEAVAAELLRAKLREIELEGWLGETTPLRARARTTGDAKGDDT